MTTDINTPITSDVLRKRQEVHHEINSNNYDPKERSFEIHKKWFKEKQELKLAKKEYRKLHHTQKYQEGANALMNQILSGKLPKWGGIKMMGVSVY